MSFSVISSNDNSDKPWHLSIFKGRNDNDLYSCSSHFKYRMF